MPTTDKILADYGLDPNEFDIKPYGTGLINHTWRVSNSDNDFILQKINGSVFAHPEDIAFNIYLISEYFRLHSPGYLFTVPVLNTRGEGLVFDRETESHFRLFSFIKDSHTIDVVMNPRQAYEASRQFGLFTKLLSGLPATTLKNTIPDFHNLSLRFRQFEETLAKGNKGRINECREAINFIYEQRNILEQYEKIKLNPNFKLRVTHHDTKINNVLFDKTDNGICLIDLDTLMPGFFISDVGDMMRTYLSPANEEEKDFDRIKVREDFFRAIVEGYLDEMKDELSNEEIAHFVYAGKFMIYMQAIRFLTDYMNNDAYYGSRYPGHNFVRAVNQITLLKRLNEQEKCFNEIVSNYNLETAVITEPGRK